MLWAHIAVRRLRPQAPFTDSGPALGWVLMPRCCGPCAVRRLVLAGLSAHSALLVSGAHRAWVRRVWNCPPKTGEPFGCFGRGSAAKRLLRLWIGAGLEAAPPKPQTLLLRRLVCERLSPTLAWRWVGGCVPEAANASTLAALCASAFLRLWPGAGVRGCVPKPRRHLVLPLCVRAPFTDSGLALGWRLCPRSRKRFYSRRLVCERLSPTLAWRWVGGCAPEAANAFYSRRLVCERRFPALARRRVGRRRLDALSCLWRGSPA